MHDVDPPLSVDLDADLASHHPLVDLYELAAREDIDWQAEGRRVLSLLENNPPHIGKDVAFRDAASGGG
ncbi:MAG: hypothetical protein IT440_05625 [Phycisphaeraceae bacterium]|nr:hypothetical protein [Phycisphaeraceae bacterium]